MLKKMSTIFRVRVPKATIRSLVASWDHITLRHIWFNIYTSRNIDKGLTIREKVDLIREFTLSEIRQYYNVLLRRYNNNLLITYTLNSMANIAGMNVTRISLRHLDVPDLTDNDIVRSRLLTNSNKEALDKEMIHNLLQFEFDELLYEFILRYPIYKKYILSVLNNENVPRSRMLCIQNE